MRYREEKFPMTTTGHAVPSQTQKRLVEYWQEYIKWKKENKNDADNNFRMQEKFESFVMGYLRDVNHYRSIIKENDYLVYYDMRKRDLDRVYESLQILRREHDLNFDLYLAIHKTRKYPENFGKLLKELEASSTKITEDRRYCDRLGSFSSFLVLQDFMPIAAVSSVTTIVAKALASFKLVAAFPAITVFGYAFLICGLSVAVIRFLSPSISQVIDQTLVTGLYCYGYHPKKTMGAAIVVSLIGLTGFAYRAYLRIAINWLVENNGNILTFIKNKGIDIKNVGGEKILFNTLNPLFRAIKNRYLDKLGSYLPKGFIDHISELLSDKVLEDVANFLISIFIINNTKIFELTTVNQRGRSNGQNGVDDDNSSNSQNGVDDGGDASSLRRSLKLEEGARDQFADIYRRLPAKFDSIDEAAKGGFALTPEEHEHVHLFSSKNLRELVSFKGLSSVVSSLLTAGTFAPKSSSSRTFSELQSNKLIQPIERITAKL